MTTATAELLAKKTSHKEEAKTSSTLQTIASEIEKYDQEAALVNINLLIENEGLNDFKLGGLLAKYQANSEWWGEYDTFKAFVKSGTVIPLHYRKAMYLIKIFNCLIDNNIPWETVKSIGWTKLRELVDVLTAENVEDWVAKAEVLTTIQLQEAVKAYKKELAGEDDGTGKVTTDITTMTFKLHPDQKEQVRTALDKAKAELETEVDTVALEGICTAYLGGTFEVIVDGFSLTDALKKAEMAELVEALDIAKPDVTIMGTEAWKEAVAEHQEALKLLTSATDTVEKLDAENKQLKATSESGQAVTLTELMATAGPETVLQTLDQLWPELELMVVSGE